MLNEKFLGMITSVSAGIKTIKDSDGTKIKMGVYNVKLESADIDYESVSKFNPNISATLLNIQPMPFKSINFGDQSAFRMMINFFSETEESIANRTAEDEKNDQADAAYGNVLIKTLVVTVKENIPIYIFSLEIPMAYDGKFLFKNIKSRISFEFDEMDKREITKETI
jgi:hypothetical protein